MIQVLFFISSSASFQNRFPGSNQKLVKRLLKCESKEFGDSNFARTKFRLIGTVVNKFSYVSFSSNPKIALEQVVGTYRSWIEANLGRCEAPYKGIKQRKHLVSVQRLTNFCTLHLGQQNQKMERFSTYSIL